MKTAKQHNAQLTGEVEIRATATSLRRAGSIPAGLGRIEKIGADRLAYECARQVIANNIDSRSGIGDALLDYLRIGQPGQPDSVPEWMDQYEKSNDQRDPLKTGE